jgi:GAF domain-containing protein
MTATASSTVAKSASSAGRKPGGPRDRRASLVYALRRMAEQSDDLSSRLQEYQQRLEELIEAAREGIERQAPEVLDKFAATADNIARRLEDMASEARQRAAEKEATPEPAGTSEPEPADAPPASSGESGTAGA